MSLPTATHPEYQKYVPLLSPGWILGRKVDNSDGQYSGFRDNIPYLFLLLLLHPVLRGLFRYGRPQPEGLLATPDHNGTRAVIRLGEERKRDRIKFDLFSGIIYVVALHGVSAFKVFLILYINYHLATRLPKRQVPAATWIFNIGILFANELCRGYPLAAISGTLFPSPLASDSSESKTLLTEWASYIDGFGGLIPRWEVLFKITILRLISFDLDLYWGSDVASGSPLEVSYDDIYTAIFTYANGTKKKQLDPSELSERDRVSIPVRHEDVNFRIYLAYVLYPPLYIAGPIITFNDYVAQQRLMPKSVTFRRTVLYGTRFLIALLTMELILHFIYAVAICKAQPAWEVYTPFQVSMLGYFNLFIIWLKLLLPWRFFRLWALIDGVDPPENMVRCMSDNYSVLAFWRGWHRSFNRWIVRYLYVPLGGSGGVGAGGPSSIVRSVFNMLLVFTFVALWHDIQLRLLIWGWLITFFVLPELTATFLFPPKAWSGSPNLYRIICGVGAVGNILMLMVANLVGFAIGVDGLKGLLHSILGTYSGKLH